MWKVKLRKVRATWYWFTENPQGGGFGSNLVGPKKWALHRATENIPAGSQYQLFNGDKLEGVMTRE